MGSVSPGSEGPVAAAVVFLVILVSLPTAPLASEARIFLEEALEGCASGDKEGCLKLHKEVNAQHEINLKAPRGGSVYVFGYGSLINKASRVKSGAWDNANKDELWVDVKRLKRSWSYCAPDPFEFVALGCEESSSDDDTVSGVLFKMDPAKLEAMDQREAEYVKLTLDISRVVLSDSGQPLPARFRDAWMFVYVNPKPSGTTGTTPGKQSAGMLQQQQKGPTRKAGHGRHDPVANARRTCPSKPIVQSYVDLVLSGFVIGSGLSEPQAAQALAKFVKTTAGWPSSCGRWQKRQSSAHIQEFVDERRFPRAMGPLASQLVPWCKRCVDHKILQQELCQVGWFKSLPTPKPTPSTMSSGEVEADLVVKLFAWIDTQLNKIDLVSPSHKMCRQEPSSEGKVQLQRPPFSETELQVAQDAEKAVLKH